MKFIIILGVLACLCVDLAYGQEGTLPDLSTFVSAAQKLYDRAAIIVNKRPTTENDVDHIVLTMGNQWHVDEHAFQTLFWPWRAKPETNYPVNIREGMIRIWQFDNFIFDAISASYVCKNTSARWNLKIAGELLSHAKMASKGHPDPDWDPNLDSAPDDRATCSQVPLVH